jgi:hypothetical protein
MVYDQYRQLAIMSFLTERSILCDLGQRRASARGGHNSKRRPSYSGMMSYEKAMRELPFLKFMLTGSIVIAGIEIQGG